MHPGVALVWSVFPQAPKDVIRVFVQRSIPEAAVTFSVYSTMHKQRLVSDSVQIRATIPANFRDELQRLL